MFNLTAPIIAPGLVGHEEYFKLLDSLQGFCTGVHKQPILINNNIPPTGKYSIFETLRHDCAAMSVMFIECNKRFEQYSFRSTLLHALNQVIIQSKYIDPGLYKREIEQLPYKYRSVIMNVVPALQTMLNDYQPTFELPDETEHAAVIETVNNYLIRMLEILSAKNKIVIIIDNIDAQFSSDGFGSVEILQKTGNISFIFITKPPTANPIPTEEHQLELLARLSPRLIDLISLYKIMFSTLTPYRVDNFNGDERMVLGVMAAFREQFDLTAFPKLCC